MNGARYGKRLSVREREVLGGLCEGEKAYEIAARLCITVKTVECHMSSAKIKLGARTTAALTYQYAMRYRSEV